jgi:hypothetical protein
VVPLRGPGGFCIRQSRLTADIDATIAIALDDAEALVEDMSAEGFDSRVPDVERFAALTRVLPLTHRETGIPVDLVVAGPGLEEDFLRRARWIAIEGAQIPVIAPEDLVVTKMLAGPRKKSRTSGQFCESAAASSTSASSARAFASSTRPSTAAISSPISSPLSGKSRSHRTPRRRHRHDPPEVGACSPYAR